jgi:hypothetical protein
MSTFQTLLALAVLVYALCVIVQAVQEVLKSVLNTKANTMAQAINKFMGDHLPLQQICDALKERGLDITALEHFSKEDFRHLLDGIELSESQVQGVLAPPVAQAAAAAQQLFQKSKDHMAGVYEGARAQFQKSYTSQNKKWVIGLSFAVVIALNSSLIIIYDVLAADQKLSQAIAGTAATVTNQNNSGSTPGTASASPDIAAVYTKNRQAITKDLQQFPILLRTCEYPKDLKESTFSEILGLLLMGTLVSLGAPFWNDVLKGMMGVNNALNTNGKKTS